MSSADRPKIIVDDDWKSRVQAEKESLSGQSHGDDASPPATQPTQDTDDETSHEADSQLPPPTFEALVSMLVTQSLASLGQIPLGPDQKPVIMLDHAKHYIDLLAMLQEKTKGNLTSPEADMLERLLHELRMVFVAVSTRRK